MPVGVTQEQVEQRILEQSARTRGRALLTGWAALRMMGGSFFDGLSPRGSRLLPVPLAANGERLRSDDACRVIRSVVPAEQTALCHGLRCAGPEWALVDEMRLRADPREAVVAVDMALAAGLTTLAGLYSHLAVRPGIRHARLVQRALEMADPGSRSPQETRLRMIWEYDAGWGRPLTNCEVLDLEGRFIGIPDLLDPARGIAGEYDGAHHRSRARHARDVRRADGFRSVGLEYVEFVGADLVNPYLVVDRLHEAERRAGRLPRRWRTGRRGLLD